MVDDDEFNLEFIEMILTNKINYDLALSGKEALELMSNNTYDMVLTDINMPEMDGKELLIEILKIKPD